MPAFYAHARFGNDVLAKLRGEIKEVCVKNYSEFSLGVQGPDYLFFYKPLSKNRINQLGYQMHELTCSSILNKAMPEIKKMGIHSKGYAYVLGFICHYILDSECHPYVSEMMKYQKMGHLDIEGEFEKYLLLKDGHKPETYRLDTLVQKQIDVLSIQRFYPELDVKDVENAIVWTRRCKKFVTASHAWKRTLITTGLKVSGKYRSLKGVMLTPTLNSKAAMSNEGLYLRYQHAIELAVDMLTDFQKSVIEDKPLNKRFDRNFE